MLREVLEIQEATLGRQHPSTAVTIGNLAMLLEDKGELKEAEGMYKEVLAIEEATLGHDHPETAATRRNLAALLKAKGK